MKPGAAIARTCPTQGVEVEVAPGFRAGLAAGLSGLSARSSATMAARLSAALLILVLLPACSLFGTREPEDPLAEAGTFVQADTPEQVVENLENAVAELNTLNYRRSLSEDFRFNPTATAIASEPVFSSWSRAQEEQYFSTMVEAARTNTGHSLDLNDESFTLLDENNFVLDATYVLNVNHRRAEIPTTVQGRLQWQITRGSDGLWSLVEWTDQELGNEPSWSGLKAEFLK